MRTIDEIKADMALAVKKLEEAVANPESKNNWNIEMLKGLIEMQSEEFVKAATDGIPLDELETMCATWRDSKHAALLAERDDATGTASISIFNNAGIRDRLAAAFPKYFINRHYEIIIHPKQNTWFRLDDVATEMDLTAKVIEFLSREAAKSISDASRRYHLTGINTFLGTSFTQEQMMEIYTYLGNRCNHAKTVRFIEGGYDMSILPHPAP